MVQDSSKYSGWAAWMWGTHRVLGAVGVRGGDRRDQFAVLGDHLAEVAGLRQRQAADAVEVAVRAARKRPGDLVSAQLGEQAVERLVERVERLRVALLLGALLRGEVRLQVGEAGVGDALDGAADRGALERLAHEGGVLDGGEADQRHERAELPHDRDEPLVPQPRERLAHRRAAHAEQLGQLVLGQPPPRLQLGAHDRSAQRGVHLVAGGQPVYAVVQGDSHLCRLVYKCTGGASTTCAPTPAAALT
jgi:hypothetical protein